MHLSEHAEVLDDLADGQYDADVDADDTPDSPLGKRKRAPANAEAGRLSKRRGVEPITHPQGDDNGSLPARLQLCVSFRGRKTVDGGSRIFHAPRSGNFGFWDACYCRISDELDLPGFGTVMVEGWKIPETVEAVKEPRPWDEFSEIAFRREHRSAKRDVEEAVEEEEETAAREPAKKKRLRRVKE